MYLFRSSLKKFTIQKISEIKAQNSKTICSYFHAFKDVSINYKLLQRRKNLQKYLSGYSETLQYEQIKSTKLIKVFLQSFN